MVVGTLVLSLFLPESGSLKGKRRVLKSIKDRLRGQFNVSVAEVDDHDLWQRAVLGVAVVASDARFADEVLQKALAAVESWRLAEVSAVQMEIL